MSISERYRDIVSQASQVLKDLGNGAEGGEGDKNKCWRTVEKAILCLREFEEHVGEIHRIRLESELTPVLLKAHGFLDQARVHFEEAGVEDDADRLWDLEQLIYRLLNDL